MTPSVAPTAPVAGRPAPIVEVPWELSVPLADVYLVGYGNLLPNDFTLEMLAVLKRCARVFGAPPIHAPDLGVAPMESLMGVYRAARARDEVHERMAQAVLDAAAPGVPVALATTGSAMVGMVVCHRILEQAPCDGLSVHVCAAPSALDGICALAHLDPLAGIEIWDATAFMLAGVRPNARANLVLAQVGLMELGIDEPVAALRERLLRFYDADCEVQFVTAPGVSAYAPRAEVEHVRLGDLVRPGRHVLSTMLIRAPAAGDDQVEGSTP